MTPYLWQVFKKMVQFVAGFVGSPQMNLLTLPCQGRYAMLGDFKINLPENIGTVPPQKAGVL